MHDPYFDHRLDARAISLWTSLASAAIVVVFVSVALFDTLKSATSVV
jgi:hypothetical protein